jgi:hypothetical protein
MGAHISLHGRKLGLDGTTNQLISNGINITQPAVDASITVASEDTNVRQIAIVLKDSLGNAINYVETVQIIMFTTTAMTAFATTGGSTGIELGTAGFGAIATQLAKKVFLCTTEADGTLSLKWTDTGTEAVVLGVRLPNGRVVVSASIANT